MTTDWLLRVGDGVNFFNSSKFNIWGIKSILSSTKYFIKNVKPGDRLWFIKSKSYGKIIAVSIYRTHRERELGPLINVSLSNEELGWRNNNGEWDIEIHYTNCIFLDKCELLSHIKGAVTIRKFNDKTCPINLPVEYNYIERYCKATFKS
jgi:predicted secreted protein